MGALGLGAAVAETEGLGGQRILLHQLSHFGEKDFEALGKLGRVLGRLGETRSSGASEAMKARAMKGVLRIDDTPSLRKPRREARTAIVIAA